MGKINKDVNCEKCGSKGIFMKNRCKSCYYARLNRKLLTDDIPVRKKRPSGSGTTNNEGYRLLSKKNHPNSMKEGRILEHVYVMSQFLGRPLFKHEKVHHKNGIKSDNRIENLELWTNSHPSGQRVEDKIKWCKEFLDQYKDM